jgi:hypothetical protein
MTEHHCETAPSVGTGNWAAEVFCDLGVSHEGRVRIEVFIAPTTQAQALGFERWDFHVPPPLDRVLGDAVPAVPPNHVQGKRDFIDFAAKERVTRTPLGKFHRAHWSDAFRKLQVFDLGIIVLFESMGETDQIR